MAQIPRPRAAEQTADVTVRGFSGDLDDPTDPRHDSYTQDQPAKPTEEQLVRETMPLVGYVVTEIVARLPAHVRREDLESAGFEALVRCARSYDPAVGTSFSQYARIRVRGAVLDELRASDWATRGARRAERRLSGAEDRLTQELGRQPSPAELAADLGAEGADLVRTRDRVQRAAVLSLNAYVGDSDVDLVANLASDDIGQEERIVADERAQLLHAAVEALPERLRQVISEYFLGERPMAEIARELGVSESRISQMRAQALELLREGLTRQMEGRSSGQPEEPGVAARRREEYYARVAALAGSASRRDAAPSRYAASASTSSVLSALA